MLILQQLYRLKALDFEYVDFAPVHAQQDITLPNSIGDLNSLISKCHLCDLSKTRTQSMPGYGNINADIILIDYEVTQTQDQSCNYYGGRSGELLIKMIENVLNLTIDDVYLTHIVKCKSNNLISMQESWQISCNPYIVKQLEIIKPKIVVALGENAYKAIASHHNENNFSDMRGHIMDFKTYKLIPVYHPAFLLRNPSLKKIMLHDLRAIKSLI